MSSHLPFACVLYHVNSAPPIIVTHDPVAKQILYQPYTIEVLGSWKTLQPAAVLPFPSDGTSDGMVPQRWHPYQMGLVLMVLKCY